MAPGRSWVRFPLGSSEFFFEYFDLRAFLHVIINVLEVWISDLK